MRCLITVSFVACFLRRCPLVRSQESTTAPSATTSKVVDANEFDDRTLLDTFGEAAKQYLTQKVIPPTDPECKWDWRSVRCEPFCQCAFSPKKGDYHLGRACRLDDKINCDPIESVPEANSLQLIIQRMVQGARKVADTTEHAARNGYEKIQTRVCQDMREVQCQENGELPVIAWQERVFCQHKIPTCDLPSEIPEGVQQLPQAIEEER